MGDTLPISSSDGHASLWFGDDVMGGVLGLESTVRKKST